MRMRKLTIRAAINEALRQEMRRDPNVYVIGEDVGIFGAFWGNGRVDR